MAYHDLNSFVRALEQAGELKRVVYPVKAELEITEIADRVMKSGGPALLFENVIGKQIPVLINAFGSQKRMALALGVQDIEEIAAEISKLIQTKPPKSFKDKLQLASDLIKLGGIPPKIVKDGACQEVILREPDLNILPVLTCWPGDAGPFITLPMVFSKDPVKGTRNVGLYRLQVFHVTCITHRRNPIYPTTIVGRPPMEDAYLGKATERLFLPLLRVTLPEIVDMNLPVHGVFHNLAIISIKKEYPAHARKVMHALWGLGQMMFTKILMVVDHDVNVQDLSEVTWVVGNHIDPKRDTIFVDGPVDILDHAAPVTGYGTKIGIDATRKWHSEGFARQWPDAIVMDEQTKQYVDSVWDKLGL